MAKDFTFKQFHINAFQCGMPVSTDAVLLGAWANITAAESILDIGCGTGILSLMCAQRNQSALISAIEIEENAFQAATHNIMNSPWSERLSVYHQSLADFTLSTNKFSAIICNPPYFNSGEVSQSSQRAVARHANQLTHADLLHYCCLLLKDASYASFILPVQEGRVFLQLAEQYDLQVSRLTQVKTTPHKAVSRLLIELTNITTAITTETSELIIHNGQQNSDQFINLTKDFYLKM